jgi:L-threonylcarbamoyladenylate synthase
MEADMLGKTKYWPAAQLQAGIEEAAAVLADGGIVAFPTETVYGLGGDARNTIAVERIFTAKGRPSDNPLIVHVADQEGALSLVENVNEIEQLLMTVFWPGPLTLVLPVREGAVSPLVTAGLDTVAVRVPANEIARALIMQSRCPLAAPSANRSGRPSPTLASHVMEDLVDRIDGVIDGGPAGVGLESTVVRVLGDCIHILRPGGITREQLMNAVGEAVKVIATEEQHSTADLAETAVTQTTTISTSVTSTSVTSTSTSDPATSTTSELRKHTAGETAVNLLHVPPRSPGVKYTHYAPKGEMLLITGSSDGLFRVVQSKIAEATRKGHRVGVLSCTEHLSYYNAEVVFDCGSLKRPELAAKSLYSILRQCDERGLDFIIAEGYPEQGIGAALMNRMRKAAGGNEIRI